MQVINVPVQETQIQQARPEIIRCVSRQKSQIQYERSGFIRGVSYRAQDVNPEVRASTPAHEWRVVCDSMLGGLAKQLRMCGCNCIHIEYDRGGDHSIKVAFSENRVLLTRNGCYQRVRSTLLLIFFRFEPIE